MSPCRCQGAFAMSSSNGSCGRWCFDPVAELPGDIAAICLSFLDAPTLLGTAQGVSRAWHNAIDGGLPAVWHNVNLERVIVTDALLAKVVRRSHGAVRTLKSIILRVERVDTTCICSLSNLRVLHLHIHQHISFMLPLFPLLEDLHVQCCSGIDVVFPPLHYLTRVQCTMFRSVQDLHNLCSLKSLHVSLCSVDSREPWPASLRDVTILRHCTSDPRVVQRIAGLQKLVSLRTDWSFVSINCRPALFTPPYDQLSFLADFVALQKFSIDYSVIDPHVVIFPYLGAMSSLLEFRLCDAFTTDQDLESLSQLTNLHTLLFFSISTLTSDSIRVIARVVPNLSRLSIMYCRNIVDYSPIGSCSQLRDLQILSDRPLTESTQRAIAQLHQLKSLTLRMQLRDTNDLSAIFAMRSLRMLDLHNLTLYAATMPVCLLSGLSAMSSLEDVRLFGMRAEDLSALVDIFVQMPNLRNIWVGQTLRFSAEDEKRLRDALPRLVERSQE